MPPESDEPASTTRERGFDPFRVIDVAGSVKFGITLLFLIVAVSFVGMIVPQINVTGFDKFFASLTPWQQSIGEAAGLFDIYGSWYFKLLLMALALNIALSSVEHFPNTWKLIRNPPLSPSAKWIASRELAAHFETPVDAEVAERRIIEQLRRHGFRRVQVSRPDLRRVIFAESGAWNRLGAYAVHVALLTILAGGLVTSFFSYSGEMRLSAGESSDRISEIVFSDGMPSIRYRPVPFTVRCTDLQQIPINPKGPLESSNSFDWLTTVEIEDDDGKTRAVISLNRPFDHEGHRFFHSTFVPIGKARSVTIVAVTEEFREQVSIDRGGTAVLGNGQTVRFVDFRSNLNLARDTGNENSVDYPSPAAILEVTDADGAKKTVIAVRDNQLGDRTTVSTFGKTEFRLRDFEKVADRHVLIVRRDPGTPLVYAGSAALVISLLAVFFFSHRRLWISIEPTGESNSDVTAGADSNRDREKLRRVLYEIGNIPR